MNQVKFRHPAGVVVASVVAFCGAIPLAASGWYLAWLPLVPLLVAIWGLRSGTDADADGITVRALLASRREPWAAVTALDAPDGRHAVARLANGTQLRLTAVTVNDLPALAAASGHLDADEAGTDAADHGNADHGNADHRADPGNADHRADGGAGADGNRAGHRDGGPGNGADRSVDPPPRHAHR